MKPGWTVQGVFTQGNPWSQGQAPWICHPCVTLGEFFASSGPRVPGFKNGKWPGWCLCCGRLQVVELIGRRGGARKICLRNPVYRRRPLPREAGSGFREKGMSRVGRA